MIYLPTRIYRESGTFTVNSLTYSVQVLDNFQVPHIYIEGDEFSTLLRMEKPEYWYTTFLSDSLDATDITQMDDMRDTPGLAEALNKFLKSKDKETGLTYWKKTIRNWNVLNPEHKLSEDTPIPDYTKAKLDPAKLTQWGTRLDELIKNAEARFPKYEIAWCTLMGYDVGNLRKFYKDGFRVVGVIPSDTPCVLMERPAVDIHEIVEDEFL